MLSKFDWLNPDVRASEFNITGSIVHADKRCFTALSRVYGEFVAQAYSDAKPGTPEEEADMQTFKDIVALGSTA